MYASSTGFDDGYQCRSNIRIRFGRAIRRIREEQEINQEEAAERCGLHRTYYSVNLEKIAKGLKTNLPGMFGRV